MESWPLVASVFGRFLPTLARKNLWYPGYVQTASLFKMAARQTVKENLQCTPKYGYLRISQDICHVRMTDIEGFLTIYGHSGNLLNNNY